MSKSLFSPKVKEFTTSILGSQILPGLEIIQKAENKNPTQIFYNQEFQITINNNSFNDVVKEPIVGDKKIDLERLLNRKGVLSDISNFEFFQVLYYSHILNQPQFFQDTLLDSQNIQKSFEQTLKRKLRFNHYNEFIDMEIKRAMYNRDGDFI